MRSSGFYPVPLSFGLGVVVSSSLGCLKMSSTKPLPVLSPPAGVFLAPGDWGALPCVLPGPMKLIFLWRMQHPLLPVSHGVVYLTGAL